MAGQVPRTTSLQSFLDKDEFQQTRFQGTRRIRTHQYEPDVQSYRKVVARSKTAPKQNIGRIQNWQSPEALATAIWDRVVHRLQSANISTQRLNRLDFSFALPNTSHTTRQLAIFDALHHRPMTVTNAELNLVLPLESYGPTSGSSPEGSHFYIRSWTLTEEELRDVISEMSGNYDEVMEWKRVVDLFAPKSADPANDLEYMSSVDIKDNTSFPTTLRDVDLSTGSNILSIQTQDPKYFTIRYVGTVDYPRNPFDRFIEDLHQRNAGIFVEFQDVLERKFPIIADAGEVHLIKDASLSLDPGLGLSSSNQDMRERFLIEFFDHATLLNRQHGGYFADYIPSSEDVEAYKRMKVDFYFRLHQNATFTPPAMQAAVVQHFSSIQNFANSNAGTGTGRHPYTNGLRDTMTRQAQPFLYRNKAVLMLIIGKDITLDNYLREVSFFEGKSHSGTLTRDLLRKLAAMESAYTAGTSTWNSQAFTTQLFPFVDLWNWLWHQQPNDAAAHLQAYLGSVQPLIAASLSRPVNGVTRANFLHHSGVKMESFLDIVGVPTIQYYDQSNANTYDESTAFINIAHWHPGSDKYTAHQYEVRRVLDMTWQLTELIGKITMDYIDSCLENDQNLPTRLTMCQDVLEFFEDVKTEPEYAPFLANYAKAKQELKEKLARQRKLGSDDVRPILDKQGRLRMAALGQAEHEPNSERRRNQILSYWDRNIPDLHLVIPRQDDLKDAWMDQFQSLATGQFFFMQVLASLPSTDKYIQHLVRTIQPEWKSDDSWMQANDKKEAAIMQCGLWFHKRDKDVERQRGIYGAYPDEYATAYDLQGRMVGVSTNGGIRLRWLQDGGSKVTVILKVKRAIPTEGEMLGLRSIDFTEDGIDILDAHGTPFRTYFAKWDTSESATIPKVQLAGTEGGSTVLEMWNAVRLAHGHKVVEEVKSTTAKVWNVAPGVKGIANNATTERPAQNRPPKIGDALYPLEAWLDERFPNGGELQSISTERVSESTEDLQDFIRFLKSGEWSQHPHVDTFWLPKLEKAKPEIGMLEKNIRILRSTDTDKRTYRRPKVAQAKQTVIIVGRPGSAAPNPFPAKADGDDDGEKGSRGKKKKGGATGKRKRELDTEDDVDDDENADDDAQTTASTSKRTKTSVDAGEENIATPGSPPRKRKTLKRGKPLKASDFGMDGAADDDFAETDSSDEDDEDEDEVNAGEDQESKDDDEDDKMEEQ